ncbi:MAG TPA: GxxExxY protein [Acidobacteriota bacterium]|nr:GxxExxY protein [Acidobacteriota bacterium]
MNTDQHRWNALTKEIIGCGLRISNALGCGFLEKVYENAMVVELRKARLRIEQQKAFEIVYAGTLVGVYSADLIVESSVIVEIKAVKSFDAIHEAQLLNYLKATGIRLGLLMNFGIPRLGIRRLIF